MVAELSRFNIEINGTPQPLAGDGLRLMEQQADATFRRCVANAHDDVDTVVAIGTLPTLRDSDLSLEQMTPSNRYYALNRETMHARGAAQLVMEIDSAIAGGTALLSAPLLALGANSPFLFGHALWHETRVPLFDLALGAPADRV